MDLIHILEIKYKEGEPIDKQDKNFTCIRNNVFPINIRDMYTNKNSKK